MVSKGFALVHVRDMDLDDQRFESVQGIEDGDRRMGECGGIDHDSNGVVPCFVNPVDDFVLAIALMEPDVVAEFPSNATAISLHIGKRLVAIDMRLTLAEKIEVGPFRM